MYRVRLESHRTYYVDADTIEEVLPLIKERESKYRAEYVNNNPDRLDQYELDEFLDEEDPIYWIEHIEGEIISQ